MIPRYRARLDLEAAGAPVTAEAILACALEWISGIERTAVAAPGPGVLRLPGGSEVAVVQHVHAGRALLALRYDRAGPGGAWRAELGFEPVERGARVYLEISSGASDRVAPGGRGYAPGIARMLVTRYAASAGIPLSATPVAVAGEAGVGGLLAMLTSPARRIPIVCVALAEEAGTAELAEVVQRQTHLMGLAQVVVLGDGAASLLSRRIAAELGDPEAGRQWGVFEGAVRLYGPRLDLKAGNPFQHRVWLPRASELERASLEQELFDTLAWASAQEDDPGWIDSRALQRMVDRDALREAKLRAGEDARFYEEYCRRLEADKERLEQEKRALAELRREANERADEAQRGRESLRYQYEQLAEQARQLRRSAPAAAQRVDPERFTVLRYCKGGQRERDCIEELELSPEARGDVEEHLGWLSSPASWSRPAGRLEHLKDDVHEFRVNVKDHWLRLLVARLPRIRAVVVLHAFAKKSNELHQADIRIALDRLRELSG